MGGAGVAEPDEVKGDDGEEPESEESAWLGASEESPEARDGGERGGARDDEGSEIESDIDPGFGVEAGGERTEEGF